MLKILHLDENHELLKNELSNLGFENCFDFDSSKKEIVQKQIPQPETTISFDLGVFMMKWSNKFVFISLLAVSAIALTKQAWA